MQQGNMWNPDVHGEPRYGARLIKYSLASYAFPYIAEYIAIVALNCGNYSQKPQ